MLPQNLVVCNLFLLCAVSTHSSLGLKITIQPHYCYIRYLYTGYCYRKYKALKMHR